MPENRLANLHRWLKRFQPEPEATEIRELLGKYAQVLEDNMRHTQEIHALRDRVIFLQQEVQHMEGRLKVCQVAQLSLEELAKDLRQSKEESEIRLRRHHSLVEGVKDLVQKYRQFEEQEARVVRKRLAGAERPAASDSRSHVG